MTNANIRPEQRCFSLAATVLSCLAAFAPGEASEQTPPAASGSPTVVATVAGEPIYASDLARWYRRITRGQQVSPPLAPVFQAQALAEVVDRRLVLAYARRTGSGATQAEVDQAVQELKAALEKKGLLLDAYLKERQATESDVSRQMFWNLTWQKFLARYITEERIAAWFNEHRRQFDGTELNVSHILLQPEDAAQPGASEALVRRAGEIREEIVSGTITFEDAARRSSRGPSRESGGMLGWITWQGPMDESFTRAAFALNRGEVSQPVESPFGVHLIRSNEVRPGTRPASEVRSELEIALARDLLTRIARAQSAHTRVEFAPGVPHFRPGTRELVR